MKEIDLLPELYKSGQRRRISYRTQYIALCGVLLVMVVWNFAATHSISEVKAQLGQMSTRQLEAQEQSCELAELKGEMKGLEGKAASIDEIDSKINVASILAEMSFLIDKGIVISKVAFVAERFRDKQQDKPSERAGNVVRAVSTKLSAKREQSIGDVRFRVTIGGIAADASDVASLICKLKDSPYFCQVVSSVSETGGDMWVSEFEINCYLANYREQ